MKDWAALIYAIAFARKLRAGAHSIFSRLLPQRFRGAVRAIEFASYLGQLAQARAPTPRRRGSMASSYLSDLIRGRSYEAEASNAEDRLPHEYKRKATQLLHADEAGAAKAADDFSSFVDGTARSSAGQGMALLRSELFRLAACANDGACGDGVGAELLIARVAAGVHALHAAFLVPITRPRDAFFFPSEAAPEGKTSLDRLLKLIRSAKVSVDVCVYAISDNELSAALKQLHRSGVAVRVVSDHEQAFASGATLFSLAQAGLSAVVDDDEPLQSPCVGSVGSSHPGGWGSPPPAKPQWHPVKRMHHKFCVIDGQILCTGSFNWTYTAHTRNCENLLVTADADAVHLYVQEFERLYNFFRKTSAEGESPNEAARRLEALSPTTALAHAPTGTGTGKAAVGAAAGGAHGGPPKLSGLAALEARMKAGQAPSQGRPLGAHTTAHRGSLAHQSTLSNVREDEYETETSRLLAAAEPDVASYRALLQRINPKGSDASWLFASAAKLADVQLDALAKGTASTAQGAAVAPPPGLLAPAGPPPGLPPGLAAAPRNTRARRAELLVTLNRFCCVVEEELMRRRQHVEAVLFFPSERSRQQLCALLRSATHTLDCAIFTLSDERIADELHAAHARGVTVRLITDDTTSLNPDSQIWALAQAGVETVVDSEIEVWRSGGGGRGQREQHRGRGGGGGGGGGHPPLRRTESVSRHMHHKFALIDHGTLVTGSFNWTWSASFSNAENILITDDAYHVRKYTVEFERLWHEFKRTTSTSKGEAACRIQAIIRGRRGRDHAFGVLCAHPQCEELLGPEGSGNFKPLQVAKRRSIAAGASRPPGLPPSRPPGLAVPSDRPPGL